MSSPHHPTRTTLQFCLPHTYIYTLYISLSPSLCCAGVNVIDSSVSGLGGCPYAKGATGNVATEDVLYLCDSLGIDTGVDFQKVVDAGKYIDYHLERTSGSKAAIALGNKCDGV